MTLSDLLTVFGRNPMGGFDPRAAAAVAGLTLEQIGLILRDPKKVGADAAAGGMTERDYHREHCLLNGYPEWLEHKLWRERHPE